MSNGNNFNFVGKRSFPYDPFLLSCRDVFYKVFWWVYCLYFNDNTF